MIIERRDDDGKQIGELVWERRGGYVYDMHLDVDPSHHRAGIGRSMLEELEAICRDERGKALTSQSATENELAERFFTGCGFTKYPMKDYYGFGQDINFWVKPINKAGGR